MEYVKIASVGDFTEKCLRSYRLLGRKVAVFKKADGEFVAREAACKHQGADLTTGEVQGTIVTCPRHKWQYDLVTGLCLNHESLPLRRYGLKIVEGSILITLAPLEGEIDHSPEPTCW